MRKILHIDMDAFYASVEQRDDPALRGRPLAVGGDHPRGVVAAASYEARAFGVRSAMPSVTARRRCPELLFVAPRFDVYRAVSRHIQAIFREYTDLVEPLSLDEAYLDVSENLAGIPYATTVAHRIRRRIRLETALTASAGVSYNKFLAKMASGLRKPDGQTVIRPRDGAAFVAALPVARFHGVGPATAARMRRLGIETGADLRAQTLSFLQQWFGKSGGWYYRIARGEDDRPVLANRPRKSVGSEDTFLVDLSAFAEARLEVAKIAERVWRSCAAKALSGRTVTLKVKYADFRQITRSRTLPSPVAGSGELLLVAEALLQPLFPARGGIRLLGVTLSSLQPGDAASDPWLPGLR